MIVECLDCGADLEDVTGDTCSCGQEIEPELLPLLALRRIERAIATRAAPERRRHVAAGILSHRATARRLGIGRDTLARLIEAGEIATVPKGERRGFRAADVEALIERGWKLGSPEKPAPKRTRRRPVKTDAAPVQRIRDLPY